MAVFILRTHLFICLDERSAQTFAVRLVMRAACASQDSIKTGTRRIMRLDEPSFVLNDALRKVLRLDT